MISALASPIIFILHSLEANKFWTQYIGKNLQINEYLCYWLTLNDIALIFSSSRACRLCCCQLVCTATYLTATNRFNIFNMVYVNYHITISFYVLHESNTTEYHRFALWWLFLDYYIYKIDNIQHLVALYTVWKVLRLHLVQKENYTSSSMKAFIENMVERLSPK